MVSVEHDGEGFRLRLDDATCDTGSSTLWTQSDHVTNKHLSVEAFQNMKFDEKELADLGYYILARLGAFIKRNET